MKVIKMILTLSFLLFLYITICAVSYATNTFSDISESVFRLHVVANSNSYDDQLLKITVRDNLLDFMNDICKNVSSKDEAINLIKENEDSLQKIALETISNSGYNYPVSVNIGNFNFPTKAYGDITLPSGFYDALKVEIGEAKGENWWCVMFPPLCFVDVSSGIVRRRF